MHAKQGLYQLNHAPSHLVYVLGFIAVKRYYGHGNSFFFFFFFFFLVFGERVSLCSFGCPGTHFVNQVGLKLKNPPASASQVLGLKANLNTHRDPPASASRMLGLKVDLTTVGLSILNCQ